METIKVNMNPNPLDVQTIHASQNDGEARQWGFELHNNGDVIDASEISDQLVFKAYKGGTEQILPENGSVPTTSPIIADIKYPHGELTDQEFLYRESPTEEDGLAKITDIKGNTLVWNQLSKANTELRSSSGMTLQVVNGLLTISGTPTANFIQVRMSFGTDTVPQGHKVLLKGRSANFYFRIQGNTSATTINDNVIFTAGSGIYSDVVLMGTGLDTTANYSESFYPQIFDLTQMGLDSITNPTEFTSLFPLPYYDYNVGSLLSFNGTGLKTGGENLIDFSTLQIGKNWFKSPAVDRAIIEFAVEENKEYTISFDYSSNVSNAVIVYRTGWNTGQISNSDIGTAKECTFTPPSTCKVVCIQFNARVNGFVLSSSDFYGFWNCALTDTISTTTLPISTYFPTGMKDVPDYTNGGKIHDELSSSRADTRVGSVDLGTLDWTLSSSSLHIFRGKLTGTNAKIPNASDLPNALLANYQPEAYNPISANDNGYFALGYRSADDVDVLVIIDNNYSTQESFISHVSGQYLFYELATPTETPFTTASLVTENAEIPLSNDDGTLIGKCTEQLSENPGFIDAKIKLSDADGECYSNKLQLHVERSPQ